MSEKVWDFRDAGTSLVSALPDVPVSSFPQDLNIVSTSTTSMGSRCRDTLPFLQTTLLCNATGAQQHKSHQRILRLLLLDR